MAARFWVGGSGTWNNSSTANWSATSGGASGASAPTNVDTVTFDTNSGTAATVTVASTAVSLNTTINKADINLSLSGSPTLCTSAGTLTFTTGTLTLNTYTLTCGLLSSSNSNTRAIAFGSGSINLTGNAGGVLNFNAATNFTYTGTPTVNLTYSGATGTRTIFFGAAGGSATNALNINVTAGTDTITNTGVVYVNSLNFTGFAGTYTPANNLLIYGNITFSSGMTISASANSWTLGATSGTQQITTNGKTLDFPITFNGIGGTFAFQDALTQGSTRAFTIINGTVKLKDSVTSTVGVFTTSGSNQKNLQSTTSGTKATLSQASGTVSASYLTIQDIAATGGAVWNAYTTNNNIDAGNNSGWDFSSQIGRYIYTRRKNKRILP